MFHPCQCMKNQFLWLYRFLLVLYDSVWFDYLWYFDQTHCTQQQPDFYAKVGAVTYTKFFLLPADWSVHKHPVFLYIKKTSKLVWKLLQSLGKVPLFCLRSPLIHDDLNSRRNDTLWWKLAHWQPSSLPFAPAAPSSPSSVFMADVNQCKEPLPPSTMVSLVSPYFQHIKCIFFEDGYC